MIFPSQINPNHPQLVFNFGFKIKAYALIFMMLVSLDMIYVLR